MELEHILSQLHTEPDTRRVAMLASASISDHARDHAWVMAILRTCRTRLDKTLMSMVLATAYRVAKYDEPLTKHINALLALLPETQAQVSPSLPPETPLEPEPEFTTPEHWVKLDTGLSPAARHITGLAPLRLYWITQTLITQQYEGRGWIEIGELKRALPRFRVHVDKKTFSNWLKAGEGWYWHMHNTRLYLIGQVHVWGKLADELCSRKLHSIAQAIHPQTTLWLDLSGTLETCSATLYLAWMQTRAEAVTMSRDFLSKVWHVEPNTLRRWEQDRSVDVQTNYAQYGGSDLTVVPAHAYPYRTTDGEIRYTWRIPNTYRVSVPHQRGRTGQRRKCRHEKSRVMQVHALDELPLADGDEGVLSFNKRYFSNPDRVAAHKAAHDSMKKRGDWQRTCYVRVGEHITRKGAVIGIVERYDNQTGIGWTDLGERDFSQEQTPVFQQMRTVFTVVRPKYVA